MAKETYSHVSSSLLRQIASFGGDLGNLMPSEISDAVAVRVRERAQ